MDTYMRKLIVVLLLMVNTANADNIECNLTWVIDGGRIQPPVFRLDAKVSQIDLLVSPDFNYSIDIGGGIEFKNGAWKVNKLNMTESMFDVKFELVKKKRTNQWLRGRMERHIPHKDTANGSIPFVATKFTNDDIISKLANRWPYRRVTQYQIL